MAEKPEPEPKRRDTTGDPSKSDGGHEAYDPWVPIPSRLKLRKRRGRAPEQKATATDHARGDGGNAEQ